MDALKTLLAAAALALSVGAADAAPAMWLVSDADSRIWLFGTIHFIDDDQSWHTPLLDEAIANAQSVYFETNLNVGPEAAGLMLAKGLNLGGKPVTDYLDDAGDKALEDIATTLDMPLAQLNLMKPWFAATVISAAMLVHQGYDAEAGVDMAIAADVPDSSEKAFETLSEQVGFLADWPEDVQADILQETVTQLAAMPDLYHRMITAWKNGDAAALEKLLFTEGGKSNALVMDRLIYERNANWAEALKPILAGSGDVLVAVGAGHLVGERGLPALLAAQGAKVERIQ